MERPTGTGCGSEEGPLSRDDLYREYASSLPLTMIQVIFLSEKELY